MDSSKALEAIIEIMLRGLSFRPCLHADANDVVTAIEIGFLKHAEAHLLVLVGNW